MVCVDNKVMSNQDFGGVSRLKGLPDPISLDEAATKGYVDDKFVKVPISVSVPNNYATIQEAIYAFREKTFVNEAYVVILLEDGTHVVDTELDLSHSQSNVFVLQARNLPAVDPSTLTLDPDPAISLTTLRNNFNAVVELPNAYLFTNYKANAVNPLISIRGILFVKTGAKTGSCVRLQHNFKVHFYKCGFHNFYQTIKSEYGCSYRISSCVISHGNYGLDFGYGSNGGVFSVQFNECLYSAYANMGSVFYLNNCTFNGGNTAVYLNGSSKATLYLCDINDATFACNGYYNSTLVAHNSNVNRCNYGFRMKNGMVLSNSCTFTDVLYYIIDVWYNSYVEVRNSTSTGSGYNVARVRGFTVGEKIGTNSGITFNPAGGVVGNDHSKWF